MNKHLVLKIKQRLSRTVHDQNIYLSLAWQSNLSFADIEGLSLAIGVEIAESLKTIRIKSLRLNGQTTYW